MKHHFQCAEQVKSPSNFTKYGACHGKMNVIIDPRHKWNNIFNARSKSSHPSNSPSTAPATKFWVQDFSEKSMNCFIKTIRPWSEHDPSMRSSSRTRRFGDLTRPILETHFVWKNRTFRAPAISQNCTKCCACHEKSHSNFTKYCACHKNSHCTFTTYSACHVKCTLRNSSLLHSLGIYSLLASILSWYLVCKHPFSLGIYSLRIYSLRIYSLSFLKLRNSEVSHPNFLWSWIIQACCGKIIGL